ncbi:MAG: sodium-independent anion transporter [Chloroflexaceae bacterium]|nr:sodium-independent anion transporter [Chloroflexaceae bacterium]
MTLVTIIVSGLVVGVVVGIVVAIIIFTVAYSRMNVIKHELPGSIYHSNHSRSYHQQQFLRANGQQIHILRLQGYLFFGTTHTLVQRIQDLFEGQHQNRLRFLILDLRDIRGLDSSATLGFTKLRRLARDHHVSLVYTAPNRLLEQFLKQQGIVSTEGTTNRLFADLDRGLEWCENQLIEPTSLARQHNLPLALQLYDAFASSEHVSQFITYLERHEWPAETPSLPRMYGIAPSSLSSTGVFRCCAPSPMAVIAAFRPRGPARRWASWNSCSIHGPTQPLSPTNRRLATALPGLPSSGCSKKTLRWGFSFTPTLPVR